MAGGPSQVDMFDPKPALVKYPGTAAVDSVDLRTERQTGGLLPSPFQFSKYGKSGVEVSELLPQLGSVIDDICVIRSMYTFNPTHTPARSLFHTGSISSTRPSIGAWVSYGLGTENENLPAFVVLGRVQRAGADRCRAPDSCPRSIRASRSTTPSRAGEDDSGPAKHMAGYAGAAAADGCDAGLNRELQRSFGADEYLEGRIKSMEAAYRMQFEATGRLRHPQGAGGDPRRSTASTPFAQRLSAGAPPGGERRPLRPRQLRRRAGLGRPQRHREESARDAAPTWIRRRPR